MESAGPQDPEPFNGPSSNLRPRFPLNSSTAPATPSTVLSPANTLPSGAALRASRSGHSVPSSSRQPNAPRKHQNDPSNHRKHQNDPSNHRPPGVGRYAPYSTTARAGNSDNTRKKKRSKDARPSQGIPSAGSLMPTPATSAPRGPPIVHTRQPRQRQQVNPDMDPAATPNRAPQAHRPSTKATASPSDQQRQVRITQRREALLRRIRAARHPSETRLTISVYGSTLEERALECVLDSRYAKSLIHASALRRYGIPILDLPPGNYRPFQSPLGMIEPRRYAMVVLEFPEHWLSVNANRIELKEIYVLDDHVLDRGADIYLGEPFLEEHCGGNLPDGGLVMPSSANTMEQAATAMPHLAAQGTGTNSSTVVYSGMMPSSQGEYSAMSSMPTTPTSVVPYSNKGFTNHSHSGVAPPTRGPGIHGHGLIDASQGSTATLATTGMFPYGGYAGEPSWHPEAHPPDRFSDTIDPRLLSRPGWTGQAATPGFNSNTNVHNATRVGLGGAAGSCPSDTFQNTME
ncbi:hypothetical protein QBC46DRAFT_355345 [Diplogelasinospora grovesii]|uniref:Uncharacterized protein n=1 Tax=Diplogelasinospora grovesii TaxID=303347 RepID=A0AAN6S3I0_9PEZI|nr:hypothetical protein QBC46DRAFT_355345 [Diplogelasinospora grovesii]